MAWLSGWRYRKSVTLSRASGAVTNYQRKLLVSEGDGRYDYSNVQINEYKESYGISDTDNVILSLGTSGTWDDERIHHPYAMEKDGTVYLYYSGYDGSKWRIGVATAAANGFTGKGFTKSSNNPVLTTGGAGAWDENGVLDPFVIYDPDASIWKMWFRGINASGVHAIGYATSNNPDSGWTKHGSNPILFPSGWEGNYLLTHSIIRENATTYKMLYTGGDPAQGAKIGLATSTDGVSWNKYGSNPVITPTGTGWEAFSVFSPRSFYRVGNEYRILYCGKPNDSTKYSKIGYAYSNNLTSWTRGSVNPVLGPSKSWEGYETENPNILRLGETEYVYYDCWFGTLKTIGGAVLQRPILNGRIQNDFDDLRFTSSDGETLLDYWIESIVGITPNQIATVWVKFNSIGTGATTFYMYYGNPGASAVSNGANTFPFFDDFSGDLSKWTTNGTVNIVSGICRIEGANSGITGDMAFGFGYAVRAYSQIQDTGNYGIPVQFENEWLGTHFCRIINHSGVSPTYESTQQQAGGTMTSAATDVPQSTNWRIREIRRFASDNTKFYIDNLLKTTLTTNTPTGNLRAAARAIGKNVYVDWILVRYCLAIEPAWGSWGDEESAIPIDICVNNIWKDVSEMKICLGQQWKDVSEVKICIGNTWKNLTT